MGIDFKSVVALLVLGVMGCSKYTPSVTRSPTEETKTGTPALPPKDEANAPLNIVKHAFPKGEGALRQPKGNEPKKPIFKLYVKVEKVKPKKIEFVHGVDWEDQYRTSLIEGDLKKPTRVTKLLEGPANCGSMNNAVEEGAGEDKSGIIYFLICWNAGAGHTIEFFQAGQTITVERSSVSEDEEGTDYQGPDDGEIHSFKVPKGVKVEFELLYP